MKEIFHLWDLTTSWASNWPFRAHASGGYVITQRSGLNIYTGLRLFSGCGVYLPQIDIYLNTDEVLFGFSCIFYIGILFVVYVKPEQSQFFFCWFESRGGFGSHHYAVQYLTTWVSKLFSSGARRAGVTGSVWLSDCKVFYKILNLVCKLSSHGFLTEESGLSESSTPLASVTL